MARLADNSYGKSDVRLTKVVRKGDVHSLFELTVGIMLGGAFEPVYTEGDNSPCIPTDTMKNTVYALAKRHDFDSPESFAKILAAHFLGHFSQVAWAEVKIEQAPWERIDVKGSPHPHAFTRAGSAVRTCLVRADRHGKISISGGLQGLDVIKTTRSGFAGFLKDPYTTLAETSDRIFSTRVDATWLYAAGVVGAFGAPGFPGASSPDFSDAGDRARQILLETFATHDSKSVQQTMYAMGEALLAGLPEISSVSLSMPNKHRILVNLEQFGMGNANEIFVATSEPFGLIKATVTRE
jgi:urate oxidase